MTQQGNSTSKENNIWLRGVFMILFGILYSLAGTVLVVVAVLQFILVLTGNAPNTRLLSFGHSLGSYVRKRPISTALTRPDRFRGTAGYALISSVNSPSSSALAIA